MHDCSPDWRSEDITQENVPIPRINLEGRTERLGWERYVELYSKFRTVSSRLTLKEKHQRYNQVKFYAEKPMLFIKEAYYQSSISPNTATMDAAGENDEILENQPLFYAMLDLIDMAFQYVDIMNQGLGFLASDCYQQWEWLFSTIHSSYHAHLRPLLFRILAWRKWLQNAVFLRTRV